MKILIRFIRLIISKENIVDYLIDKSLISPEAAISGEYMFVDYSRRNMNIKVLRKNKPGLFVKQIKDKNKEDISAIEKEVWCYSAPEINPSLNSLSMLFPKLISYDKRFNILITELNDESESFNEYHYRLGIFPQDSAASLGKLLAACHRLDSKDVETIAGNSVFPKKVPWNMHIHNFQHENLPVLSPANASMIQIIKSYPDFMSLLDDVSKLWRVNSFIHGDMRWDNCITYPASNEPEERIVKIIDWESSDIGDSCWDIGAVFQAFIYSWILSIDMSGNRITGSVSDFAYYPLESMHPAINSFWKSYTDSISVSPEQKPELLERSIKYCAMRLIQSVYELSFDAKELSPHALFLLQVSMNILKDPPDAIKTLFIIKDY